MTKPMRFVNRVAKPAVRAGELVLTLGQVRRAAIRRVPLKSVVYRCLLCGDSWRKGEEHHSRGPGNRRCLLAEKVAP